VNGKVIGTGLTLGGLALGIVTVHLITILAVLMVLSGVAMYKVSGSRKALGGSSYKSLLK
jgi:hypothetical protein